MSLDLAASSQFLESLRVVNSITFSDEDSGDRIFETFTWTLSRLGLRGALLLPTPGSRLLAVRAAASHPVVARLERMLGLRTDGHQVEAGRVAVYRAVLMGGRPIFVEDSREVVSDLLPAVARPFLSLVRQAFAGTAGIFSPLRQEGVVVGVMTASGALRREDVPAFEALGDGISLGLDAVRRRHQRASAPVTPVESGHAGRVMQPDHLDALQTIRSLEEQRDALEKHAIVTVTDTLGRITYANDRFCALSGYSREELLGHTHAVVKSGIHPPELFRDLWHTITAGRVWQGELCNRARDGRLHWLAATIVPLLDDAGRPREFIAFRTDLSKQKETERELRRAKDAADEASAAKSTFLANMSHELRTPMNAIIGMTQLSLDQHHPTGELKENLEVVLSSANGLLATLNDVLDLATIERDRLVLEVCPFDLAHEVETTLRTFAHLAGTRGLELRWIIGDTARGLVMGDALRVRQILGNVVSNAVKFTERGSVAVSVSRVATRVTLVVEDSGIGIAEDKREHIFAPFEQADTSPTRAYGGAGLGLSITRRLAQLMGGEVALTSTEGVGTKVTVELHLPVATALPLLAPVVEPPARPLHVLVAEDNPVNQMLASRLLERWGHEVEVVGDGADAVTRAAAGGLDCILMDLNMPLLGGLEAAGRIREHERELGLARLPIIALTASAVVGEHERCLKAGMDDYVAKPIKPEVLQRVLAACVTRAGQAPGAAESQAAGALPPG